MAPPCASRDFGNSRHKPIADRESPRPRDELLHTRCCRGPEERTVPLALGAWRSLVAAAVAAQTAAAQAQKRLSVPLYVGDDERAQHVLELGDTHGVPRSRRTEDR